MDAYSKEILKPIMDALKEDLLDPDAKADWDAGALFHYMLDNAVAILSLENQTLKVEIIGARRLDLKLDIFKEVEIEAPIEDIIN